MSLVEAVKKSGMKIVFFVEKVVIPIFGLIMLGAIVAGIYAGIRDAGYIPQSSTSPVLYPEHGWEVGEYVRCLVAKPTDKEPYLECNESDMKGELMRKMEVHIWGEVMKTPKYFLCQRKETSIVCHLEKF